MSNKKIIRIWGGLGNQLFQYSYGKYLKQNFNSDILFNIEWYDKNIKRKFILKDILNFNFEICSKEITLFEKIVNYRMENLYKFLSKKNLNLLPQSLIGYWQDIFFAKYLNKSDFKKDFLKQNLKNIEEDYYVLHFRGDDFFKSKQHIILNIEYYKKSSNYFKDKVIYCISDDLYRLEKLLIELKLDNTVKLELNELEAFRLIYNSNGGIASNSTFCWWPIYLSNNQNWIFSKFWLKNRSIYDENLHIKNTLVI